MDSLIISNGEFKLRVERKLGQPNIYLSITHKMKHGQMTSIIIIDPEQVKLLIEDLQKVY